MENISMTNTTFSKIKNGSCIFIGNEDLSGGNVFIYTSKHFNWFQKKMLKLFFGFRVTDYSEE